MYPLRSEDWSNRSCRRLRIAYLSFSIKIARYCASLSAALRAARSPKSQNAALMCAGNGAAIQNVAISQCPVQRTERQLRPQIFS